MEIIEKKYPSKYWLLNELSAGDYFGFYSIPGQLYMVLNDESRFLKLDGNHIVAAFMGYVDEDNNHVKRGLVHVFASNSEVIKYVHLNDFEVMRVT